MLNNLSQTNKPESYAATLTGYRRDLPDRRRHPTSPISYYTFRGRRQGNRRSGDAQKNYYIDRFHPKVVAGALLIMILSMLDALFTLYHINQGAIELNPLLNLCLAQGQGCFMVAKFLITSVCLLCLVLHQNFFRITSVLSSLTIVYGAVLIYQVTLAF